MSSRIEIIGKSGRTYAFTRLDGVEALRQVAVSYLIAEPLGQGWRVLHAGETNNLADASWQAVLEAKKVAHPAAELLIRLNVSRSVREAELADLIDL